MQKSSEEKLAKHAIELKQSFEDLRDTEEITHQEYMAAQHMLEGLRYWFFPDWVF